MLERLNIFSDKVRNAKNIAIMAHKNLDGDALCSVLALAQLLELNYGVRCVCIYDGNMPENLRDLPLRTKMHFYGHMESDVHYDLAIVLDYGTIKNIGGPIDIVNKADFVIEIDHHINDNKVGHLCIDDDTASATACIIYQMMQTAHWTRDINVLKLLGAAILTDTGNFKYVRNGVALRIMSELVDSGVSIYELIEIMNNKPRKAIQTEAAAVADAEFLCKGRIVVATINRASYKKLDGRGETVLGLLGQVKGVEYIVLLKEQKENQIGVSLRGKSKPVDKVAVALGGGGHAFAAGAVVNDSLENVRNKILDLLRGEIK